MKFLRVSFAAILIAVIGFTALIGKNKTGESEVSVSPAEFRGILNIWHIDTFEGGVGSRKQFLLSVGRDFEKQNAGVLVMATDYTAESAEKAMGEGKFPDLISYGAGVNVKNMQPIPVKSVPSGVLRGETYALCWCRGGYCLIENPDFTESKNSSSALVVSQGEYTNPLLAYAFSIGDVKDFEILSPMDAYVKFVSGKRRYLLGTQRDINRLLTRGMDFTVKPLSGYNDLYQYISVVTENTEKAGYAQKFAEFLVSYEEQKKLSAIGMFSCFYETEYDSPELSFMQKTDIENTLSAFSSKELIKELQERGVKAVTGDNDEFIKIKKLIATP